MTANRFLLTLLAAGTFIFAGCSDDKKPEPKKLDQEVQFLVDSNENLDSEAATTLKVVDSSNKPIKSFEVLIGSELNKPFPGNYLKSNSQGQFQAPEAWTDAQPITISAPGFVRVTYLGQLPQSQTFTLREQLDENSEFELAGLTTGFQIQNGDGLVDFGLVIPALDRTDLFQFDLTTFVSPQTDKISIAGREVAIPSNITLPAQRESYFIPINLAKPTYRTYFRNKGSKEVVSLRGKFPLKEVVDGIRGGQDFTDLINSFSILGGGIKSVQIDKKNEKMDLAVDQLNFTSTRSIRAPQFTNDKLVVAAALSAYQGKVLYPTDVKKLTSNEQKTLVTNGSAKFILTALKLADETKPEKMNDRLSAAVQTLQAIETDFFGEPLEEVLAAPRLLPLMENPRVQSTWTLKIDEVKPVTSVLPTATYAVLSKIKEIPMGKEILQQLTPVWEVYSNGWAGTLQVPEWPGGTKPNGKLRWGVTLVGGPQDLKEGDLGPRALEQATHATHSSADF